MNSETKSILIKYLQNGTTVLVFLIMMLVGWNLAPDFAVSWDDPLQRAVGKQNWEYATQQSDSLLSNPDRYYGSAWEVPLYWLEIGKDNLKQIYTLRHRANHLLFVTSLIFLYFITQRLWNRWILSLLLVLTFYLWPSLLAHSFFNSKDLPFMSVFIIGLYTALRFFEQPNSFKWLLWHAVVCGFLIDIRIVGILLPLLSFSLLFFWNLLEGFKKSHWLHFLFYTLATFIFVYLFWPALWQNPLGHWVETLQRMANFPWRYETLFQGQLIKATENPWYFLPIWIGITTPLFILSLYLFSVPLVFADLWKKRKTTLTQIDVFIWILILLPIDILLFFALIKPVFYDGWRQVFFLAPLMILGVGFALIQIRETMRPHIKSLPFWGTVAMILLFQVKAIQELHPYSQVYFNKLISHEVQSIRKNYEQDYWGLSYAQGFETLLRKDARPEIKVLVSNEAGVENHKMIQQQKSRIKLVNRLEEADYFITNFRYHPEDYDFKLFYEIQRQNSSILTIYEIEPQP